MPHDVDDWTEAADSHMILAIIMLSTVVMLGSHFICSSSGNIMDEISTIDLSENEMNIDTFIAKAKFQTKHRSERTMHIQNLAQAHNFGKQHINVPITFITS